jgi:hypothetical protein
MPAKVILESAGSHCFDMPHLKRSGTEELIQILLEKAGYFEEVTWRVRVNEKQTCSGMTTPISVIRHKKWGIYLRVKSGDNNTCHNVTLIVPSGYKSGEVFGKLKIIEKSFNRNWRKMEVITPSTVAAELNGSASTTVLDCPLTTPTDDELLGINAKVEAKVESIVDNKKFDLQAFLSNNDNIKAICLSIYSMEDLDTWKDTSNFMNALCDNLSICLNGHQGGAMMRSIMGKGLADRLFDKKRRHVGYRLTRKGKELIKDDLLPHQNKALIEVPQEEEVVQESEFDKAKLLHELGPIAGDIYQASLRLKEIDKEMTDHLEKIKTLDEEKQELCELLGNAEINNFISRLVENKIKSRKVHETAR